MSFASAFTPEKLAEAWEIVVRDFPLALWDTLYVTVLATFFAILLGLPLGMILVACDEKGIRPWPAPVMKVINVIINFLRSVPFLILIVMVIPITRLIVGTSVGTVASIVPLVIAAFPFVARLVETSIREVDGGVVEAAQSMGAGTWQIILKVLIPEARPALISNFMVALITIFGYGAMSGAVGGGGLGRIAVNYGYNRYQPLVMYFAVILLVILVQIFQGVGNVLVKKSDKRIR